jgi:predicted ribosome quality control (RQC) complex YloA/Tae2 family protein
MKFREIVLASGTKFLLGKDAKGNDELMKKFRGKENKIIHTVAPGSPFCVIENLVFEGDIHAAGAVCAKYSQDWRDNKRDVDVNVFTGKDVSKGKSDKPGTWKVKKSKVIKIKKEDILKLT